MAPRCPWVKPALWLFEIVRFWPRLIGVGSVTVLFDAVDVSAPGNGRGVDDGCGRAGLDVHRERHGGIARSRGQRVGSRAGDGLERDAARPARAAAATGMRPVGTLSIRVTASGGRCAADIAHQQVVVEARDGSSSVPG